MLRARLKREQIIESALTILINCIEFYRMNGMAEIFEHFQAYQQTHGVDTRPDRITGVHAMVNGIAQTSTDGGKWNNNRGGHGGHRGGRGGAPLTQWRRLR